MNVEEKLTPCDTCNNVCAFAFSADMKRARAGKAAVASGIGLIVAIHPLVFVVAVARVRW